MLNQWILPIFETDERQSIGGQCFVVGANLMTAAHVVDNLYRPYVMWNEHKFYLTKDNAAIYSNNRSEDEDIAIFSMQEINSPLHFIELSSLEQELTCFSVKKVDAQTNQLEIHSSAAHILSVASNKAIICELNPMLCECDSGSPVITENYEVIGMLVGGVGDAPCNNICAFQSAAFIQTLINHEYCESK